MLREAGERGSERVDVRIAEAPGGPGLEFAEVEFQPDDRKMRIQRGPDVDGSIQDAHD
jgi:predicted lipoprotein